MQPGDSVTSAIKCWSFSLLVSVAHRSGQDLMQMAGDTLSAATKNAPHYGVCPGLFFIFYTLRMSQNQPLVSDSWLSAGPGDVILAQ